VFWNSDNQQSANGGATMNIFQAWRLSLLVMPFVAIAVMAGLHRGKNPLTSIVGNETQDVIGLDRRISLLEQRFYAVESKINRLEQQVAFSQRNGPPSGSGRELELLRNQIELLERRLVEIDCGLVKLDERTLTPTAREGRKNLGTIMTDPCRLDPGTPLRLSTRP
jgi:hypothetical protein